MLAPWSQAWARELFDAVPSGKGPKPSFAPSGMPFRGDGLCILAPSVTERHFLEVTFQLPSLLSEYGKKAEDYVAHCIGHEAKGSLLSALKARGIASDLAAGVEACSGADRNTAFFLFTVGITLTERGARDACGREALEMLFGYIAMLRARGPQRWIWDELKLVSEMKFRFAEEDDSADLASAASVYAQMYRPEHVLCADYLFDEYDPDLIT